MGDTFAVMRTLEEGSARSALIVGAGYVGLEMADALSVRGLSVAQIEQLPEVLPTVDPELGTLVHRQLVENGVAVQCATQVRGIERARARCARSTRNPSNERRRRDQPISPTSFWWWSVFDQTPSWPPPPVRS